MTLISPVSALFFRRKHPPRAQNNSVFKEKGSAKGRPTYLWQVHDLRFCPTSLYNDTVANVTPLYRAAFYVMAVTLTGAGCASSALRRKPNIARKGYLSPNVNNNSVELYGCMCAFKLRQLIHLIHSLTQERTYEQSATQFVQICMYIVEFYTRMLCLW